MNTEKAIIILGNDAVYDWIYAFLNSLRRYEPALPVFLIPFDDNIGKIARLLTRFNFQIVGDERLEALDEIGQRFHPKHRPNEYKSFRRLAAFWAPCDTFLYMDADIIVLSQLGHYFELLSRHNLDLIYVTKDEPPLFRNQIYKYCLFRDLMKRTYNSPEFNPGMFWSKHNLLTFDKFAELAERAAIYKNLFIPDMEAPFFNYCVDVMRFKTAMLWNLDNSICRYPMAGAGTFCQNVKGLWNVEYAWGDIESNKIIPMIHWNEFNKLPNIPNYLIYSKFAVPETDYRNRTLDERCERMPYVQVKE